MLYNSNKKKNVIDSHEHMIYLEIERHLKHNITPDDIKVQKGVVINGFQ